MKGERVSKQQTRSEALAAAVRYLQNNLRVQPGTSTAIGPIRTATTP